MTEKTYCVDIDIGDMEILREKLIEFLTRTKNRFGITGAQRGKYCGTKYLRVFTSLGNELVSYLEDETWIVREYYDCTYTIHQSEQDARTTSYFLREFDAECNGNEFPLSY